MSQNKTFVTMTGQILPDSDFGKLLTKYASKADTIVDLGSWNGEGSTLCLQLGLRPESKLWSVEIDPQMWYLAKFRWHDAPNMTFLLGRIADDFDDFAHPGGEEMRKTLGYDFSKEQFSKAANVLDQLPEKISFLLIDSGEWAASGELDALIGRCTVIALDDCNATLAHKNAEGRLRLIRLGWSILHEDLNDRNGWGIYRKPKA